MAVLVNIPISNFEIVIDYEVPCIRLWSERASVVDALFRALRPWKINIDDMDVIDQGKNSDKGLRFRLPMKKASFFFGPSYCRFSKDDADWTTVQDIIDILQAGLSALIETAKIAKAVQHTTLSLHLQPKEGRFIDIIKPFLSRSLAELEQAPVTALASVARWRDRGVYVDGSNALANAIFLKLDRDFGPDATYEQIAEHIHADQNELFNILGVEEDLA